VFQGKSIYLHKFVSAVLVSLLVTTGCAVRPKHGTEGTTGGTTGTAGTTTTRSSLATPVNPPYPGEYKTVSIDGVEMKQGRFPQGKYGGSLVQAQIGSDPKSYNPWSASDSVSVQLGSMMFPGLLTMDTYTGEMIPEMASSVEVKPDHLTYVAHLRKGIKWSDGKPITADDVEFTYNTLVGQGYGNTSNRDALSVEGKMPKVTVIDPQTIEFVTPKKFAPFIRGLSLSIAPKHILEPIIKGADGRKKFDQLWSQTDASNAIKTLVTSGPFVLSAYKPGERVEFKRTNNYYMVDPAGKRLPYLDRLVYLIVPDVNTNLFKFEAGETDIAGIRAKDSAKIAQEAGRLGVTLYNLGPNTSTTFMMFNMNRRKNDKGKPYVTPYKSAWFNDVNFRQAINHALNRQQMVDGYLKGIGAPAWDSEPAVSPFLDPDLKPVSQDLDYSKKLLADSGFKLHADGKLYDKDGHLVEFDLLAPAGGTFYDAVGGYIKNDLAKLGMKVNYAPMDGNVLQDRIDSSKEWEAAIYGLVGDPLDPNAGANVWHSNGRLHLFDEREAGPDGTIVVKDARPWEKELDSIFDQGIEELDTAKRKQIYNRYQQIIYEQAPLIYLVTPMSIVGAKNSLRNYQPNKLSQSVLGLHNIEEIWKEGK
jgi:peptide/nickel transport system substrate-binding protein